jgi:hypothetical protein
MLLVFGWEFKTANAPVIMWEHGTWSPILRKKGLKDL